MQQKLYNVRDYHYVGETEYPLCTNGCGCSPSGKQEKKEPIRWGWYWHLPGRSTYMVLGLQVLTHNPYNHMIVRERLVVWLRLQVLHQHGPRSSQRHAHRRGCEWHGVQGSEFFPDRPWHIDVPYIGVVSRVNVREYAIHGWSGFGCTSFRMFHQARRGVCW